MLPAEHRSPSCACACECTHLCQTRAAPLASFHALPTHAASAISTLPLSPTAEDAALDFTDGSPAEAHTTAADFNQRSLIDVEEDISYDDSEGEEEAEAASRAAATKAAAGKKGGGLLSNFVRSLSVNVAGTQVGVGAARWGGAGWGCIRGRH